MEPRAALGGIRSRHRRLHALHLEPASACHPAADGRLRARHSRAQVARRGARCRRRLRLKNLLYAEEALVTWAARQVGGRSNGPPSAARASSPTRRAATMSPHAELALDKDGKFLACASRPWPISAPISRPSAPTSRPTSTARCSPAPTPRPAIYCEVKVVFTNTVPVDAYRGAGRPEATFVLERIVDVGGAEMRHRPRRAPPAQLHPQGRLSLSDAGDAAIRHRRLTRDARQGAGARRLVELRQAPRRVAAARGKLRGIGIVTYIEACGLAPSRVAQQLGARGGLYESAKSASTRPARSPSSPARTATARATRPPSPSSCRDQLGVPIDEYRGRAWRHRPQSRSAWAPTARARSRSAARPSSRRPTRSSTRARRSPPI